MHEGNSGMMTRRTFQAGMLLVASGAQLASAAAQETVVRGLDHITLAVTDLEGAKASFAALGFALKPGRPHDNGLRNAHAKFPDGTEIELITALAATDALASDYYNWLKDGDGPAFLGFYAPGFGALIERLSRLGLGLNRIGGIGTFSEPVALRRLFFGHRQNSPTDRPEHFAHANTAFSLSGIWLAGATAEQRLLTNLGAVPLNAPTCGPLGTGSAAFSLPEAEIVFLPESAQIVSGRAIVGVTVSVKSIQRVESVLTTNQIRHDRVAGCDRPSLWVGPTAAHGMWLEFRQPSGAG
jgi:catechol 2,3-dioxygenase-like lactoylglutathione lyase family enzyme